MAFEVLALRHCDGGKRVKANRALPASSRLSATARCRSRHLRTKALHRSFGLKHSETNFATAPG